MAPVEISTIMTISGSNIYPIWNHSIAHPDLGSARCCNIDGSYTAERYTGPICRITRVSSEIPYICTQNGGAVTSMSDVSLSAWNTTTPPDAPVYGRDLSMVDNRIFATAFPFAHVYNNNSAAYETSVRAVCNGSDITASAVPAGYVCPEDIIHRIFLAEFSGNAPSGLSNVIVDYIPMKETHIPYVGDCRGSFPLALSYVQGPITIQPYLEQIILFIMTLEYYLNLPVTPFGKIDYRTGSDLTALLTRFRIAFQRIVNRIDLRSSSAFSIQMPDIPADGSPLMIELIESYMGTVETLVVRAHGLQVFTA